MYASIPMFVLLLLVGVGVALLIRRRIEASRREASRERREDALKYILKRESNGRSPTLEGIAGSMGVRSAEASRVIDQLAAHGLVTLLGGRISLSPSGREMALHIIRSHRLWESYLADQTGLAEEKWHQEAEKAEHRLTPAEVDAIAARLGHPDRDPHGDVIPGAGGLDSDPGQSLNAAESDRLLRIVHLEDEPPEVYAQLVAMGLHPGLNVRVVERGADHLLLWVSGRLHTLAPMLAQNVGVVQAPAGELDDLDCAERLNALVPGRRARVLGLDPACRGAQRRRLLDFGFVPGTEVEVDMISPLNDPVAFRIRGSVVALRRDQARHVRIQLLEDAA